MAAHCGKAGWCGHTILIPACHCCHCLAVMRQIRGEAVKLHYDRDWYDDGPSKALDNGCDGQ